MVTYIHYKEFSLGDVGKFFMYLTMPHKETLEFETNEDDQAYTIDLAGTVKRGNLRDFLNAGYYEVNLLGKEFPEHEIDNSQQLQDQDLKINLWIDNTKTTISTFLINDEGFPLGATFFNRVYGKKPTVEHFVLPNDSAVLKAIRMNSSSE
jgi:hypothetical protein